MLIAHFGSRRGRIITICLALTIALALTFACSGAFASGAEPPSASNEPAKKESKEASKAKADAQGPKWKSLFDGKTMSGWKKTQFGGEGDVFVDKGQITLDFGSSLTGITRQGKFPTSNYEIRLEAKRMDGIDFFCGMTFPVKKSHCSLIVGGWAGAVVGLSNIDGDDASRNDTTKYMKFETGRWYRIRVRVTDDRIQAWIDDKQVVNQDIRGKEIDIRPEVDPSKPFGICAWETQAGLRKIAYRELPAGK